MFKTQPQKIGLLLQKRQIRKAPAYQWQDLALQIIQELGVPAFKKSSVFKVCRDNPKEPVERALNETKELCRSGAKWRYFFKLIDNPTNAKK
ncbi:MAG: hypothetical protein WC473_00110 [Patescibacteria group bacterium]|jgi:hypothetical protein